MSTSVALVYFKPRHDHKTLCLLLLLFPDTLLSASDLVLMARVTAASQSRLGFCEHCGKTLHSFVAVHDQKAASDDVIRA